jgi:hypothetical protein
MRLRHQAARRDPPIARRRRTFQTFLCPFSSDGDALTVGCGRICGGTKRRHQPDRQEPAEPSSRPRFQACREALRRLASKRAPTKLRTPYGWPRNPRSHALFGHETAGDVFAFATLCEIGESRSDQTDRSAVRPTSFACAPSVQALRQGSACLADPVIAKVTPAAAVLPPYFDVRSQPTDTGALTRYLHTSTLLIF